ncbi:MAG: molybdopterin-dependent oxidoreductase [Firmicutes bacterium]|nr:molybdopterin-dependent oxidoreductase [Bacillota bacterium]
MKKADKNIYLILVLLLIMIITVAYFQRGDAELKRALAENRQFLVLQDGATVATVSLQDLLDLQPQEFTTRFATSISEPREVTLQGVELRDLLAALNIDMAYARFYIFSGLDGYYSPLSRGEVEKEQSIYICLAMNGELLKDSSQGGYGPFMMVIRGARFAQRWCKYIEAVDLKK